VNETTLLYRVEDAARLLNVGRSTIFGLIASGELASVKLGRARRVSRRALENYIARVEGDRAATG